MMQQHIVRIAVISTILVGTMLFGVLGTGQTGPKAHEFSFVNTEIGGQVIWLPSVIVVRPGEHVVLHLMNKLPTVHGFSLDDYDIHAVAYTDGGPKLPAGGVRQVSFTAKEGFVSRFYCQFHKAHLGGQFVVFP